VQLAAEQTDPSKRHVPWFLSPAVFPRWEEKAGARLPLRVRFVRATRTHSVALYLSSLFALTASLDAVTLALAHSAGVHSPVLLSILGTLALFPLSETGDSDRARAHRSYVPTLQASENGFRVRHTGRVRHPGGGPDDAGERSSNSGEVEKLEVRYLANPQRNLSFALFSDFLDAPDHSLPGDAVLLKRRAAALRP